MNLLKLYGLTAVTFLAIDIVWIGAVASGFYRRELAHLMGDGPLWVPALLFYAIYVGGVLVFATLPGLGTGSLARAATLGAFLGFFAYATFDLTSMALFRQFPLIVVVTDMAWGTFLTAVVASAGYGFGRWLGVA
jgi:uncharacterized membrane protein